MVEKLEVIVGTYEEFLLGYKTLNHEDSKYTLAATFSSKSHTASIRSIKTAGKYLASGGADDKIIIFDMKQRKEIQILIHHEGTVNALEFTEDGTHLLTGGDDGRMAAIRVGSWQVGAQWEKAHNGSAVKYISCHPSSKMALSLGQDQSLRTWNLITGRCAYITNLKSKISLGKSPECVEWSPSGNHFILTGLRVVEILSIENAKTVKELKVDSKPASVCWFSENYFAVGLENGKILLSNIDGNDEPKFVEASEKRIKAMTFKSNILATASSSGEIALWKVNVNKKSIRKIASVNTGCRPTCIALLDLEQFEEDYLLKPIQDEIIENKEVKKTENAGVPDLRKVVVEYEDDETKNSDEVKIVSNIKKKNKQKQKMFNHGKQQIKIKKSDAIEIISKVKQNTNIKQKPKNNNNVKEEVINKTKNLKNSHVIKRLKQTKRNFVESKNIMLARKKQK